MQPLERAEEGRRPSEAGGGTVHGTVHGLAANGQGTPRFAELRENAEVTDRAIRAVVVAVLAARASGTYPLPKELVSRYRRDTPHEHSRSRGAHNQQ